MNSPCSADGSGPAYSSACVADHTATWGVVANVVATVKRSLLIAPPARSLPEKQASSTTTARAPEGMPPASRTSSRRLKAPSAR